MADDLLCTLAAVQGIAYLMKFSADYISRLEEPHYAPTDEDRQAVSQYERALLYPTPVDIAVLGRLVYRLYRIERG